MSGNEADLLILTIHKFEQKKSKFMIREINV